MRDTIERNRIEQITLIPAALGEKSEQLTLMLQDPTLHSPTLVPVDNAAQSVTVPVIRLDEFLASSDITHVDFMKIDVEGFEPQVVRGAGEALDGVDALLCELNDWWLARNKSSTRELYDLIVSRGFREEKAEKYEQHQDTLFRR
jgi:FkbM family methyltransferase